MRRIAIIMVVILQALNLQAQNGTFKAQVVDDGTGETLVGATISIDGTTTGTITDLDGFAYLKLTPGEYNIRISYISYQPMII